MHFHCWNRGNYAVAAGIILSLAKFFVTPADALRNVEPDLRQRLSLLRPYLSVHFSHNMKDNAIVGGVRFVTVPVPIRRAKMHFDVARPNHSAQPNLGIKEVGALVVVVQTRVYNLHLLPVFRGERLQGQYLVLPDIVQQPFHPYFNAVNLFCETKVRKIGRKALLLHEKYQITYENSTHRVRQDGPHDRGNSPPTRSRNRKHYRY